MTARDPIEPRCAGRWELFDSTDERDHAIAKKLCGGCDFAVQCRALLESCDRSQRGGSPQGTWAGRLYGTTWSQRDEEAA